MPGIPCSTPHRTSKRTILTVLVRYYKHPAFSFATSQRSTVAAAFAKRQIEQALGPILTGIMKERGATILLDRSSVLLAPNSIDVTQLVTQRLDMKMPSVKVELTAPPSGAQQQPQQ